MAAQTTCALNLDPSRFAVEGYCVFRKLLTPEECAVARDELSQYMARNNGIRPEHLTEPHAVSAYWLELCRHPGILDAARAVLGENIVAIMSHLIVKPARVGKAIEWHQDKPRWDSISGTDILTAWIAIDDADADNGCMKVIPSSQCGFPELEMIRYKSEGMFDYKVKVSPELEKTAVPVELAAGDISIHDSHILHASDANLSERRRAGYTIRFANALTTQIDTEKHWVPVYLVSGVAGEGIQKYVDLGSPLKKGPVRQIHP